MVRYKKGFEFLGIAVLFAVLCIYFFSNFIPIEPGMNCEYQDQMHHVWRLGWNGWAILHNPSAIIKTNINYPSPNTLAVSDNFLGLLPNWLIGYSIYHDYVSAYIWTLISMFFVTGIGAYYILRCWNIHFIASILGAVGYTFVMQPGAPEQIHFSNFGYSFYVFLFLEKYLRDEKKRYLIFLSISYIITF